MTSYFSWIENVNAGLKLKTEVMSKEREKKRKSEHCSPQKSQIKFLKIEIASGGCYVNYMTCCESTIFIFKKYSMQASYSLHIFMRN